jgi:predicted AAA+ superfamily ATPase
LFEQPVKTYGKPGRMNTRRGNPYTNNFNFPVQELNFTDWELNSQSAHMNINRTAQQEARKMLKGFKALAIVGPRQSGKTTLAKMLAPRKPYTSFENPDTRQAFVLDPRGFLKAYEKSGAIFDEAQYVPELFSYLQEILDNTTQNGKYILTGSNNFSLIEKISQSLAGRIVYLDLLPFAIAECKKIEGYNTATQENYLLNGGYPAITYENRNRNQWFQGYVRNYIERDVRLIKNISDYNRFQRFLYLCAGRVGQQLNYNNLGNEVGIDHKTIQSWMGVLQASFIVHLLPPFYNNFNKRIVKAPKLYFTDTGLAAFLLGIKNEKELFNHPFRGALFENFVITELLKNRYNKGLRSNLYYFRDNTGNELDVIIDNGKQLVPVEIKSSQTFHPDFLKGLLYWEKITGNKKGYIVYGGDTSQTIKAKKILPWYEIEKM